MVTIKKTEALEAKLKDVMVEGGEIYMDKAEFDLKEFIANTFDGMTFTISISTKSVEELN